jgi:Phosphoenolpyruvate carboxykinase N-terminal domain
VPRSAWTANAGVRAFVTKYADVLRPARVHLCDGSDAEAAYLVAELIATGAFFVAGVFCGAGVWVVACGVACGVWRVVVEVVVVVVDVVVVVLVIMVVVFVGDWWL